jgi:tetratricopeptide (TPR) repeat protein
MRILKQSPIDPRVMDIMATSYSKQHKNDLAIVWGEKANSVNRNDYVCMNNLGLFYSGIGDHYQAMDYFNRALEMKQDYIPAAYNKSRELILLRKFHEALECIDEVLKYGQSKLHKFYDSLLYSREEVANEIERRKSWPEEYR